MSQRNTMVAQSKSFHITPYNEPRHTTMPN